MLFDLRGRRRRAVQATYLTLAVLMGGGLVFFGIGGDVSGGLFDAFSDNRSGGDANDAIKKRVDRAEKRLQANPNDVGAMTTLVRDNYQLATAETASDSIGFPPEARDELRAAARAWDRYVAAARQPDTSLAAVAIQIFDPTALNRPKQAARAASIIAAADESPAAYLRVVQYATLAGDKRTADLAGKKAIDLASRSERKLVTDQVEQAKQTQQQPVQPQAAN
jgi:hypothetical protein